MLATRVKLHRMGLARGWLLCALLWSATPLPAAAERGEVLVLDAGSPGHAAFVAALRSELADAYALRELSLNPPTELAERLARASALVVAEQAAAAVWMEHAEDVHGMRSAVLYVVSRREGRALLELVQVPSHAGADLSRALSLKLAELLRELHAGSPEPEPLSPRALALSQPTPTAASQTQPQAALEGAGEPVLTSGRFWAAGRAGARFDFGVGSSSGRAGLGAELTPEWTMGRLRLALGVGAAWFPALSRETTQGSVRLSEVAPRVLLSVAWQTWLCDVGVHTAGVLNLVSAHARSKAGRIEDVREEVFALALGLHAERNLWGPLGLVLFVEAQPQRDRLDFRVNDESVIDRERLRITWGLDLRLRTVLSSTAGTERALDTRSP